MTELAFARLINSLATLSLVAAAMIALWRWRSLGPAYRLIGLAMVVLALTDLVMYVLARHHIPNLIVNELSLPLSATLLLLGLRNLLTDRRERVLLGGFLVCFLIGWVIGIVQGSPGRTFDRVADPVHGLLIISAAALVLLRRVARQRGSVLGQPWFWVCTGLMLNYGSRAILFPLSELYRDSRPDLLVLFFSLSAAKDILGNFLIGRALWLPAASRPSGGSTFLPVS
ncbi:MAG: hypothetical protein ABI647_15900 [Gemmatimonadota bacterium]